MSQEALTQFRLRLVEDDEFQKELAELCQGNGDALRITTRKLIKFAASHGYVFTEEDVCAQDLALSKEELVMVCRGGYVRFAGTWGVAVVRRHRSWFGDRTFHFGVTG